MTLFVWKNFCARITINLTTTSISLTLPLLPQRWALMRLACTSSVVFSSVVPFVMFILETVEPKERRKKEAFSVTCKTPVEKEVTCSHLFDKSPWKRSFVTWPTRDPGNLLKENNAKYSQWVMELWGKTILQYDTKTLCTHFIVYLGKRSEKWNPLIHSGQRKGFFLSCNYITGVVQMVLKQS